MQIKIHSEYIFHPPTENPTEKSSHLLPPTLKSHSLSPRIGTYQTGQRGGGYLRRPVAIRTLSSGLRVIRNRQKHNQPAKNGPFYIGAYSHSKWGHPDVRKRIVESEKGGGEKENEPDHEGVDVDGIWY
eukprot:1393099-Amorphochlora_amoeboformis.AAC.2